MFGLARDGDFGHRISEYEIDVQFATILQERACATDTGNTDAPESLRNAPRGQDIRYPSGGIGEMPDFPRMQSATEDGLFTIR